MNKVMRKLMSTGALAVAECGEWTRFVIMWMPGRIGNWLRVCYLRRVLRALGHSCTIAQGIEIRHPRGLTIGSRVALNAAIFNAKGGITIGDNCLIAAGAKIWSINHVFSDPSSPIIDQGYREAPIVLEADVWVASNAIILPGVTVGRGAVVAAGAVVVDNVPSYTIVGGVPAKQIGCRIGDHSTVEGEDAS